MNNEVNFEPITEEQAAADLEKINSMIKTQEEAHQRTLRRRELERESAAYSINNFMADIRANNKSYVPTGFHHLDHLLDGGLYAGLYIIGAISSLGKTSFVLQIADQIAKQGTDVLIFSLEMARSELMSKSISRLTLAEALRINYPTRAKTTRDIMTGKRYSRYDEIDNSIIQGAINTYKTFAENIYITEAVGDLSIAGIAAAIKEHTDVFGKPPVAIIDYLQIVQATDIRATDKQNTDITVLELKRMSRFLKVPIIGISSFNRDNYNEPVNNASFKESGAIEYSSDVLIGLQYAGMDYIDGETEGTRKKRIRELIKDNIESSKKGITKPQKLELKILKNRNGSKGSTAIKFVPMFNHFEETEQTAVKSNWVKATDTELPFDGTITKDPPKSKAKKAKKSEWIPTVKEDGTVINIFDSNYDETTGVTTFPNVKIVEVEPEL